MKRSHILFALIAAAGISACQSTPVTGRKQLMLVSEQQAIDASKEAYVQTLQPVAKQGKLNDNPALTERVRKITARLIPQAIAYRPETQAWDWQVNVIDEPNTINAWCMAGGRMAIYTGIIQKLNLTDDEIAQVMGHEIAHALAKHTAERMSRALAQNTAQDTALQIGSLLLGGTGGVTNQLALQAAAAATTVGLQVGLQLPNSRTQESEADRIGIELAAKAGYDPRAAPTLWKKMMEATGEKGKSDFLSTHPASEKRFEALAQLVPQMMPFYESKAPRPTYQFKTASAAESVLLVLGGVCSRALASPEPQKRIVAMKQAHGTDSLT